jgi:hypothetical protein
MSGYSKKLRIPFGTHIDPIHLTASACTTDRPNRLPSGTTAASSAVAAPNGLRPGSRAFWKESSAAAGGKKLESFTNIEPVIELPVDHQGWRFEFFGKQMR